MSDNAIAVSLQAYLDGLVAERPAELQAMETLAAKEGFPIIGPACGAFCRQIARLISARRVFELGSGFGYSTAWLAQAVRENGGGEVHHTVWDQALSDQARRHLGQLGLADLVRFHCAEAVEALRATPGPFDLIFNDIDKDGYPDALPVIAKRLRPGGVLIVDNMLWGNRVFDPTARDEATEGVRRLTRLVMENDDWDASIVPIRDGLLFAVRR
jgi:caffeoyl-CoA O-methyltransferase